MKWKNLLSKKKEYKGSSRTRVDGVRERVSHLKVEKKMGRNLRENEVVHHIDGDPTNDRASNLMPLTIEQHGALERNIDTYAKKHGKRPPKKWQEEYVYKV